MTMPKPDDAETKLATGMLLYGALVGPQPRHFRLVHTDVGGSTAKPHDPHCFLLEVQPTETPHTTVLPKRYPLALAQERLSGVLDSLRTSHMLLSDEDMPAHIRDGRDKRFSQIEPLVTAQTLPLLMTAGSRAPLIRQRAVELGVQESELRRLLTRFWWYGCDRNALIPLRSLQGGAAKERLSPGKKKRGRPNAIAIREPNSPLIGVNYNEKHREKFIEALQIYYQGQNFSLRDTYIWMKHDLYKVEVKKANGTILYRRVPDSKIPKWGVFYRRARQLIAQLGLRGKNLGALDYATQEAPKMGSARDIAAGPGDTYDMDATEFKFEVVASFDSKVKMGKPTVYMVVDRGSSAIVGLWVECRPERWEGYRRALYSAFAPKTDFLERSGVLERYGSIWTLYGIPNAIFSDRGPARSEDAIGALCKELRLEKALAPTKRGDMNAVVESLQGKVQLQLSSIPGGYTRRKGQAAQDRRSAARENALLDERAFMRVLVAAAHDHNQTHDVWDLVTPEMHDVPGHPIDLFRWGRKNSSIAMHRHMETAELYARLLPSIRPDPAVTNAGVKYKLSQYNSPELQHWRRRQIQQRLKIKAFIGGDPRYLYWRPTPGTWAELTMSPKDQVRTSSMGWDDITRWREKALQTQLKTEGRRKKMLPIAAEREIREAEARKQVGGRQTLTTASVGVARKIATKQATKQNNAAERTVMRAITRGAAKGPVAHDSTEGTAPLVQAGKSLKALHAKFFKPE